MLASNDFVRFYSSPPHNKSTAIHHHLRAALLPYAKIKLNNTLV